MDDDVPVQKSKVPRVVIGCLAIVLLVCGGLVALGVKLTGGSIAAVNGYVSAAREAGKGKGDMPRPLFANADTEAVTRLLGRSTDSTMREFTVLNDTSCYTASVDLPGGATTVQFFLVETADAWQVASLSTGRACTCLRSGEPRKHRCSMVGANL